MNKCKVRQLDAITTALQGYFGIPAFWTSFQFNDPVEIYMHLEAGPSEIMLVSFVLLWRQPYRDWVLVWSNRKGHDDLDWEEISEVIQRSQIKERVDG